MNKQEIWKQIDQLEQDALYEYLDKQGIGVDEYINAEVMGLLEYQTYVDLYFQLTGKCYECKQNPCDEGCAYQVNKESEQTNE